MTETAAPDLDFRGEDGSIDQEKVDKILVESRQWPPEMKKAAMSYMKAAAAREKIKRRYANAAEIAAAVDPEFNITPAIQIIADAIETVLSAPRRNLLVTMPPQEGKSTLCAVFTPIRAWQLNPNRRVIVVSYGDDLALTHSSKCREWIERYGSDVTDSMTGAKVEDKIGLKLSSKSRRMDSYRIEGAQGGLVAAGIGSAITGRPADLFIIDDPYKNMQEADSATHREKVNLWMHSVAETRLSPSASMILIQTRWHPEDLSGVTLEGERELEPRHRSWRHINVPAIAEEGIYDSLNRPLGEVMVSARGRGRAEFEQTKRKVGERVWYAMYQGSPRNPAGGLFMRSWFDPRVEPPANPVAAVIGVDPADSGEGDETGIIVGQLAPDGTIVLVDDASDLMTSDQWAKKAVELALQWGAREIALEGFSVWNTYRNVVKAAWDDAQRLAREALASGAKLTAVQKRALNPNMPFVIGKYTEAGDAEGRAALLRQHMEIKKCRVVPYKLGVFEDQAADWQTGQHCPDRVSAAVICHWRLDQLGSGRVTYGHPLHNEHNRRPPPERLTRRISDGNRSLPFASRGRFDRRP